MVLDILSVSGGVPGTLHIQHEGAAGNRQPCRQSQYYYMRERTGADLSLAAELTTFWMTVSILPRIG
jgi:hypothetical protein